MADETPGPPDGKPPKKPDDNADLWKLLGSGMQLAATVALFAALGWWLEQKFRWPDWSHLAIGMFGVVLGLYHFVKDALR